MAAFRPRSSRLFPAGLAGVDPPASQSASARIRTSLALLVLGCLMPGALMSTYFIVSDYRQNKARAERNVLVTARAVAASLDQDLSSVESGLRVLATASPLVNDDLQSFYQQATYSLPYQQVINYVLIDAQGRQRINTLRPFGAPLPQTSNPPQLQKVFEARAAVLTDVLIGPPYQKPIVFLGVPVERHGQIAYSLNAGILPSRIGRILMAQGMAPDWLCAILDSQGKIVARSQDTDRYVMHSAVPDLIRRIRENKEGVLETRSLDGIPVITAFTHSSIFDWTVAVGIPREELTRDLKESLMLLLVIQAGLFAGAMWLAWRLALARVVIPADRLLARMRRIAVGLDTGAVKDPDASFEFVALDEGFTAMGERLKQRDQEREVMIKRLVDTLESINEGFYLLDEHWRFTYVNRRAEALLKLDRKDLLGKDHWSVVSSDDARLLREAFDCAIDKQEPVHLDMHVSCLDLWVDIHAYPSDHGLAVYFQDVGELRAGQQAKEAQRMAEASNRAKTEFLSRMSHELRTPLNAVLGFTQVLQMDQRDPLTGHQQLMLGHIESSGRHLLEMISDVLDVSRIEAGTMQVVTENVDVVDLAQDCQSMLAATADAAGVRLETQLTVGLPGARADSTRLKQVLLNLLGNAIKYNRRGGTATLVVRTAHEGRIRFEVRDTGMGLSPEQLAHLFEPFNRLGREQTATPGTGIGLVISQRLVQMMGGELVVSSTLNEGSSFSFSLPQTTS